MGKVHPAHGELAGWSVPKCQVSTFTFVGENKKELPLGFWCLSVKAVFFFPLTHHETASITSVLLHVSPSSPLFGVSKEKIIQNDQCGPGEGKNVKRAKSRALPVFWFCAQELQGACLRGAF